MTVVETSRRSLNAQIALRLTRLVSELQRQTPSSPEADLSFPPNDRPFAHFTMFYGCPGNLLCFKAGSGISYVLMLVSFRGNLVVFFL